ncbi:MAG: alpha/beta hydrolase fold domain-containing protein, partial [Chitinophagaceae bacterium]|nr:alpha/beta hydrolase fold domain-containing protein [Chitinophagaceae bacterium]
MPVDYATNPSQKYPLIIFLPGVGELGDGSASQLPKVKNNSGLAKLIDKGGFPTKFTVGGKDYSFIVIAPQFSTSSNYTKSIDDLLAHIKSKYRIDESRIYLTGLSLGGGMAYDYTAYNVQKAEKIAGILPVCPAFTSTEYKAGNLAQAKLPIWITVNSGDAAAYPANAKDAITKIKVHYSTSTTPWITLFDKSGHDAWTKTYDPTFKQGGYNVYEWMLLHSRGSGFPVVETNPPTAKAGANQTITLPTNTATLDASGSTASAGTTISSFSWSKVSGPASGTIASATTAKTTVSGLSTAGTYVYEVKVTDNTGKSATATVTITVKSAATASLTARAGDNQTITLPTSSVTLDGSGSTPAPGTTIQSYSWTK